MRHDPIAEQKSYRKFLGNERKPPSIEKGIPRKLI